MVVLSTIAIKTSRFIKIYSKDFPVVQNNYSKCTINIKNISYLFLLVIEVQCNLICLYLFSMNTCACM